MFPNLDSLPFDLIFEIADYLSLEDIVHFSRTCKQLGSVLEADTLCRRTVEACALYTKEAKLAQAGRISYRHALLQIYRRRKAFSSGVPRAAGVVAHASAFIYREGVLCCMTEDSITVLQLYETDRQIPRRLINLRSILAGAGLDHLHWDQVKFKLMHYCNGIVAILCESRSGYDGGSWIVSVEVGQSYNTYISPIGPLESTSKIFVRHTATHLFYGMHCGTGNHDYPEWKIRGGPLSKTRQFPQGATDFNDFIQLDDFAGSDIGSTVVFEIHDGYFYALSNQTTFEAEEVDWTSFYHCVRFPLDRPDRQAAEINKEIFRRQHAEGPINDSWTDLSLQADERTNDLMIVEARREWRDGGSEQHRTFYTRSIEFSSPSPRPLYPDDPLVRTIDSRNHPNWMPSEERRPRNVHPEYGERTAPSYGLGGDSAPSFMLSKTKLRAYNRSCSAFLDLVEDNSCCPSRALSCLRLRIGSRRVAPLQPLTESEVKKGKQAVRSENMELMERFAADPEDRFVHSPITMWPSNLSAAAETERLHRIMNAHAYSGQTYTGNAEFIGVVDERSLVYMARPAGSKYKQELAPIVFVSFDPDSALSFARRHGSGLEADINSGMGCGFASDTSIWSREL